MLGELLLVAEADKLRGIIEAFMEVDSTISIRGTPSGKFYAQTIDETHGLTAILHLDRSWFHHYSCIERHAYYVNVAQVLTDFQSMESEVGHVCIYKDERVALRTRPRPVPSELRTHVQNELGVEASKTIFRALFSSDRIRWHVRWPDDDSIKVHAFKIQIHPSNWNLIQGNPIGFDENVTIDITSSRINLAVGTNRSNLLVHDTLVRNHTCVLSYAQHHEVNTTTNSSLAPSQVLTPCQFTSPCRTSLQRAVTLAETMFFHFTPPPPAAAGSGTNVSVKAPLFEFILGGHQSNTYYLVLENLHLNVGADSVDY